MTIIQLILLQVIAHLLADFIFQPKKWCDEKEKKPFTKFHLFHTLIIVITSYFFSFDWHFGFMALLIGILHLSLDVIKSKIEIDFGSVPEDLIRKKKAIVFFSDQVLHVIILTVVVWLFFRYFTQQPMFTIHLSVKYLLTVASFIFCTKPANIFIKNVFEYNMLKTAEKDLLNAGKIIGVMERLVTLALILMCQYEAVGLLIAAKSILRYKYTKKTEYVLVGTLLSFGLAILLGVLLKTMA